MFGVLGGQKGAKFPAFLARFVQERTETRRSLHDILHTFGMRLDRTLFPILGCPVLESRHRLSRCNLGASLPRIAVLR